MASIMADHNVEGHFEILLRLWTSEAWRSFWESLELEIESFDHRVCFFRNDTINSRFSVPFTACLVSRFFLQQRVSRGHEPRESRRI
jgi:hypothetical protein